MSAADVGTCDDEPVDEIAAMLAIVTQDGKCWACGATLVAGQSWVADPRRGRHGRGRVLVLCDGCHGDPDRVIAAAQRRMGGGR